MAFGVLKIDLSSNDVKLLNNTLCTWTAGLLSLPTAIRIGANPSQDSAEIRLSSTAVYTGAVTLASVRNFADDDDLQVVGYDQNEGGDILTFGGSGVYWAILDGVSYSSLSVSGAEKLTALSTFVGIIDALRIGPIPATVTAGIGLANNTGVSGRDAGNTKNVNIAKLNSSDVVYLGDDSNGYTYARALTDFRVYISSNLALIVSSAEVAHLVPVIRFTPSVSNPSITHTALEDATGSNMFMSAQGNASDTLRAGSLYLSSGKNTLAGGDGYLVLRHGGTTFASVAGTSADYLALGATPASSGYLRLPTTGQINWPTSGTAALAIGGTDFLTATSTLITVTPPTVAWGASVSAPTLTQTSVVDVIGKDLTIRAQGNSSATKAPGNLYLGTGINADDGPQAEFYLQRNGFTYLYSASGYVKSAFDFQVAATKKFDTASGTAAFSIGGTNFMAATATTIGFLSKAGTPASAQTYSVTNPVTRRTFDTTTVTLSQLAEVVGTLVGSDLKAYGLTV